MVTGIVMASGRSTRMGRYKLLLKYKGKYLIEYVLDAVNKSNLEDKIVVTGNETIAELAQTRDLKVVKNSQAYMGEEEIL